MIAEQVTSDNSNMPYWGTTGTIIWGILIALVYISLQTIIVLILAGESGLITLEGANKSLSTENIAANGYVLSVITSVASIAGCLTILLIIKLKQNSNPFEYLALHTVKPYITIKWLGIILALIVFSDVVTKVIGRPVVPEVMVSAYSTANPLWLFWFALLIAAPIFEELFFRGFLIRGLSQSFLKPAGAVLLTAFLWAIIHSQYDAYGIITIFLFGILLGFARLASGSVFTPILMHILANLIATTQAALVT